MYPAPANRLARPVEGTRLFRQGATFARFADACKRVFALPVSGAGGCLSAEARLRPSAAV